jgi:hypothetical protein
MKILPAGGDLFYAGGAGRADGQYDASSRFFAILRTRLKTNVVTNTQSQ